MAVRERVEKVKKLENNLMNFGIQKKTVNLDFF